MNRPHSIQMIPVPVRVLTVLALIGGLYFIRGYLGTVLFSVVIALIFSPAYKWFLRKIKYQGLAMAATLVTIAVSVIIPLALILTLSVAQISTIVSDISANGFNVGSANVDQVVNSETKRLNNVIHGLPGGEKVNVDKEKVKSTLADGAKQILKYLGQAIGSVGRAIANLITSTILAIFLVIAILRYQSEIIRFIKRLSPFHEEIVDTYLDQASLMTKSMVKGQFIIASFQGVAAAFSLWLVGVDYFWFFLMLLSFLSFIPLGAGIVTIPIGVILTLTGHIAQGIFVIVFHVAVVSSIDNFLRPYLVPRGARLNSALMLLAVFSGIAAFGAPGVIFGPVIMILIVTTLQMYARFNDRIERVRLPGKSTEAEA